MLCPLSYPPSYSGLALEAKIVSKTSAVSLASTARLHIVFHPAYYLIKGGAGQKYLLDSKLLALQIIHPQPERETPVSFLSSLGNKTAILFPNSLSTGG